jgi:hypothetical protein
MRKSKKDYAVGYCKPPVHARFKKGKSGNPKGRSKSQTKSLISILDEALIKSVLVKDGGIERHITKQEAWLIQLVNQALAGNLVASRMLLKVIPLVDEMRKEARRVAVHEAGSSARDRLMKKLDEMRERMIASGRIVECEEDPSPS